MASSATNQQVLTVDSGVSIKWLVPEPDSAQALPLYNALLSGQLTILAPDLLYSEVGNIVWKKVRTGVVPPEHAKQIIADFLALPLTIFPARELLPDALALATRYDRTVYDSLYLALMERENCRFVTADERLFNAVTLALPNARLLRDFTL